MLRSARTMARDAAHRQPLWCRRRAGRRGPSGEDGGVSTVLHLGPLHPVEQALTLALAFGPFLVLGVVVLVRRRRDRDED